MKIQFGSDLRKMRKNAGMSQEDVALDLHMSISNVSRLETDTYELKASDWVRWANATQSEEFIAAAFLGIDVGLLQQALEAISTFQVGFISILGGIL